MNSHLLRNVAIVGGGVIGQEYSKVLSSKAVEHSIISRSSRNICIATYEVDVRELTAQELAKFDGFIISVQAEFNFELLSFLLENTNARILVEKPVSLCANGHQQLEEHFDRVYVALNRRNFDSTRKAVEEIAKSYRTRTVVEVTELQSRISGSSGVVAAWPIANTLHVLDMALYVCGLYSHLDTGLKIRQGQGLVRGEVCSTDDLHQIVFLDVGELAGNWGIEVACDQGRFIMRPLESLQVQMPDSVSRLPVELPKPSFKPGFFYNVEDFVNGSRSSFITYAEYDFLMKLIGELYHLPLQQG